MYFTFGFHIVIHKPTIDYLCHPIIFSHENQYLVIWSLKFVIKYLIFGRKFKAIMI